MFARQTVDASNCILLQKDCEQIDLTDDGWSISFVCALFARASGPLKVWCIWVRGLVATFDEYNAKGHVVSSRCRWGRVVVQTVHCCRRLAALWRAFGGVVRFFIAAMLLHLEFLLVARPICVIGESLRRALATLVLRWLSLCWMFIGVPRELGTSAFQYCTVGKVKYSAPLAALNECRIAFWGSVTNVNDWAWCFVKLHLSVDFASLKRRVCRIRRAMFVTRVECWQNVCTPSPINIWPITILLLLKKGRVSSVDGWAVPDQCVDRLSWVAQSPSPICFCRIMGAPRWIHGRGTRWAYVPSLLQRQRLPS